MNRSSRFENHDAVMHAVEIYNYCALVHEDLSKLPASDFSFLLSSNENRRDHLEHIFHGKKWARSNKPYVLYRDSVLSDDYYAAKLSNGFDPARIHLRTKASSFSWKRSSTILRNILRFFEFHARQHNEQNASTIADFQRKVSQVATTMNVPEEYLLTWRFPSDKRESLSGERLFKQYLRTVAIRDDSPHSEGVPMAKRPIVGWSLTADFLDMLIEWRYARKHQPGGMKGSDA